MILIADATDTAVRLALTRHWLADLAARRPPHDGASAEVVTLAADLNRTLSVIALLRGTRRDVRGYQRRAILLTGRLAALGMAPPA